jgi:GTP cyclohydrolase FolE2
MTSKKSSLPDIQATPDTRGIAIDQVGVSDLRYPIYVGVLASPFQRNAHEPFFGGPE